MKNISHPVRAFRLRADGRVPLTASGATQCCLQERQLLIDGKPAPLGEHAFDLLLALIEQRQRVVSRKELADLVWPRRVVDDNALAVQLRALRKLLGPDLIATVPGRGYRFVPPLEEDGESSSESIPESAPAAVVPEPSRP